MIRKLVAELDAHKLLWEFMGKSDGECQLRSLGCLVSLSSAKSPAASKLWSGAALLWAERKEISQLPRSFIH